MNNGKTPEKAVKKKSLLGKQYITIAAALCLIVVCVIAYFILDGMSKTTSDVPELLDGEMLVGDLPDAANYSEEVRNRILMFKPIDVSSVGSVEIHNQNGEYSLALLTDGSYTIVDYYGTPFNKERAQTMISAARYMLINRRVETDADNYTEYGLDPSQEPAWFRVNSLDGRSYKVYIGDQIGTGNGYYCMLDGRDAVYILDSNTIDLGIFKQPLNSLVSPILSYPLDPAKYYMVNNFTLQKDGEIFLSLRFLSEEEREAEASIDSFRFLVPAEYVPSGDNIGNMLQLFCDFEGFRTLEIGKLGEDNISDEILEKYGLVHPKYYLYYNYEDINSFVRISEKNENGTYYAFSELFNIVAEVAPDQLGFLEWDMLQFISQRIFQRNINNIESVHIEAPGVDEMFTLSGQNSKLQIQLDNHDGRYLDADAVTNFRNLYFKIMGLTLEGYAEDTSKSEKALTLTIKTTVGNEYKYEFYNYSSRRCYYTINGHGEFYCLRDQIEMIIADTVRVVNGEKVIHEDKG